MSAWNWRNIRISWVVLLIAFFNQPYFIATFYEMDHSGWILELNDKTRNWYAFYEQYRLNSYTVKTSLAILKAISSDLEKQEAILLDSKTNQLIGINQLPVSAARWQHGPQIFLQLLFDKNYKIANNLLITEDQVYNWILFSKLQNITAIIKSIRKDLLSE